MTARKYASEQERRAAAAARKRERAAIVKALVQEHKLRMQRLGTEEFKRQVKEGEIKRHTVNGYERMLQHKDTRQTVIRILLAEHYDELAVQVNAYRLLKGL